jgi:type IV pilus assembly protein PilV
MIELLVAVVILAVGLLGLAQLQVTAIKANSQSATATAAAALAQKIIEEIAAMEADDAMFDAPTASPDPTWPGSPYTVAGAGTYDVTYKVETVVPSVGETVTNLYKVSVSVRSSTALGHVLGNRIRLAQASTVKRAI